jgi:hypothetical protein
LSVREFLDRQGRDEPEFLERLEALLACSRELAPYRNEVVHSAYVFLEGGDEELFAIVRSDLKSGAGNTEVEFDQELLKTTASRKSSARSRKSRLG